ncbi:helix-turn-helix domain-containing protein [Streptomyces sp. NPDC002666]
MPDDTPPHILKRRHDQKRQRFERATGKPRTCTPAELAEAVAHLHRLRDEAGMSGLAMAEQLGMHRTNITSIMRGTRKAIYRATYDAVMSLEPAPLTPTMRGAHVNPVGTARRLRALTAAGWSGDLLARLMGVTQKTISKRTLDDNQPVLSSVRTLVADWYEKLQHADPYDYGETPQGRGRALGRARRHGYAPPGCWDTDTIDDPDAYPEWTGACGTPRGRAVHRRAGIPICPACRTAASGPVQQLPPFLASELKAHAEARGLTPATLAARIGVHENTVSRWWNGWRAPGLTTRQELAHVLGVAVTDLEGPTP